MHWCDERLGLTATTAYDHEALAAAFADMSLADLVRGWREANTTALRERSDGITAFLNYFDRVGYDEPARALAFVEAMVEQEVDDALVALLAEAKLLGQLLHFHGAGMPSRFQEAALRNPRFRWLMGGIAWAIRGGMVSNPQAKRRLLAICDEDGYRAWRSTHQADAEPLDFATMSRSELAQAWVEIKNRSNLDRERDDNFMALMDFEGELVADPEAALQLVKAILAIEQNDNLLGLLAAGLLEDLLPEEDGPLIDAVVAEAEEDPRFQALLCGAWFSDLSPNVVAKLEKAVGESAAAPGSRDPQGSSA